ncbi:MAG: glycosyl transferase family 1, partial [Pseudomonadota bacterium]|nr:glycosyl transferase family 1 [Pseudomonadota bacterium]
MRIVHVITGLKQGGAEAMLEKLILTSRRCSPDWVHAVVTLGPVGTVGERLRGAGIEVVALDIRGPGSLLSGAIQFWRLLRGPWGDSTVQTWLYHADVFGGLLGRLAGRRVFWNLRQTLPKPSDIKRTTRWVIRVGAKLSGWLPQAIVCCANSVARSHVRIGYSARRCVLVDNGFDLDRMRRDEVGRAALRAQWNVAEGELLVGTVGRLDPLKDHDTFLSAIELAAR